MNKKMKKIFTTLIIAAIASILIVGTYAEQNIVQEETMNFIEKVIPVDLSQYNINFTKYSTLELNNRTIETLRYTLNSEESTVRVVFQVQNNVIFSCQITEKNGQAIPDKQYENLVDSVKGFLEKYQTYTKIDSTDLITVLEDVDINKESEVTKENIKLSITNSFSSGENLTHFSWSNTINGAEYTSLQVGFRKDGMLDSIYDDRALYTIGDTSISISQEQAIEIAMKNLLSYAYAMPDNTTVSNFNITEKYTTAKLGTAPEKGMELAPYWNVKLYLNQTYPGSVQGFSVFISANSGEILSHGNIAYGGVGNIEDNTDTEAHTTEMENDQPENNTTTPDTIIVVGLVVAVIGTATVSTVILKKRKK